MQERWQGVSLPGDYLLVRWLSGDDAAAFFETSLALDGRRAVVKLLPESAVDAAAQLALWQRTRLLRHPNLRELLDCGRAERSGETVLYAVFEYADDTLASALAQAPLTELEAREVLLAVRDGLSCLQAQGLAHPALDPDHVLAVGEAIKLSSDALCEAAADTPYTDALRAFWYKISPCTLARSADIFAQSLGDPTGPTPAQPPLPAEIKPIADVAVRPLALNAAPPVPLASGSTPRPPNRFPKWILVGAAGVILLILGLNLRRGPETPVEPARVPHSAPVVAAPPVRQASPLAETIAKPASKPAAKPAQPGKRVWRVIAFTYRTHDAAARKADQVNQRHPNLEATVFSPKEKKGFYLLALGAPMTRENAVRLQKRARAAGVARDVYVHNFLD